jgi:hypothetical protein
LGLRAQGLGNSLGNKPESRSLEFGEGLGERQRQSQRERDREREGERERERES